MDKVLDAIQNEIVQKAYNSKETISTIYFGGGTPSLAPLESIATILYHACGKDNPNAPTRSIL